MAALKHSLRIDGRGNRGGEEEEEEEESKTDYDSEKIFSPLTTH